MQRWTLSCRAAKSFATQDVSIPLGDEPVEIGRHPACDLVLEGRGVAERALLVWRNEESFHAHELSPPRRSMRLSPGERAEMGGILLCITSAPFDTHTASIPYPATGTLALLLGPSAGGYSLSIGTTPLTIGSAKDNDIVVRDPLVSRYHCRIEPAGAGVGIRDLASRNGTWLSGIRIRQARLRVGAVVRVGKSDFRVVGDEPGAALVPSLVAESVGMRRVVADIERTATLPWPVLIVGESGVGKEEVANALHRQGPFVALNAGAITPALVESELFGHERGAFTGAVRQHCGAFEQADGGTLFLDEIGELPLELQARLLRVLESWQLRRVGGDRAISVCVRLVCATHRDLRTMVRAGLFRQDLYYRISRLVIDVPPLRARKADIEPLAHHFLRRVEGEIGLRRLDDEAVTLLRSYHWPGNARELRNVMTSAAVLCDDGTIHRGEIERALGTSSGAGLSAAQEDWEAIVRSHGGNIAAAARTLGLPRTTLRDRIARRARAR